MVHVTWSSSGLALYFSQLHHAQNIDIRPGNGTVCTKTIPLLTWVQELIQNSPQMELLPTVKNIASAHT